MHYLGRAAFDGSSYLKALQHSYNFETINVDNATVARHSSSNIVVGLFANKRQNATNFGRHLLSRRLPPPIAGAVQYVSFIVFIYE
jgi:hypothetical protein